MSLHNSKTVVTNKAYKIVHANITEQMGNMQQNIGNAKRLGFPIDDRAVPESIQGFTHWVRRSYRQHAKDPNFSQVYLVYGLYLYVFTHNKEKLITVIHLPENTHEEARELALVRNTAKRRRAEKKKQQALDAPLRRTYEDPAAKKRQKKQRQKRKKR